MRRSVKTFLTLKNTISALLYRELKTRFGQTRFKYFNIFLEYILLAIPIYLIHSLRASDSSRIFTFIITGLLPILFFNKVIEQSTSAFQANRGLLSFHQIKPSILILSRSILELLIFVISFGFCLFVYYLVTGEAMPIKNNLYLIRDIIIIFLLSFFLGIIVGILCDIFDFLRVLIKNYLIRMIFFLSGTFFYISDLPRYMQKILLINPMAHMIESIRENLSPDNRISLCDYNYVMLWIMACFLISVPLYHKLKHKLFISK